jgi:hypothetical protein
VLEPLRFIALIRIIDLLQCAHGSRGSRGSGLPGSTRRHCAWANVSPITVAKFAAIQNDGALSYCVLAARLSML